MPGASSLTAHRSLLTYYINQAKTHSESRQYLEKLVATKECKVENVAKDQFEYFDHWYHAVVRELVTFYPYVGDDAALGLMVRPPITASQVKSSIALLERLSMIRKDEATGSYVQTQGLISSGSESYSTAVNSYIQQNLDVAPDGDGPFRQGRTQSESGQEGFFQGGRERIFHCGCGHSG